MRLQRVLKLGEPIDLLKAHNVRAVVEDFPTGMAETEQCAHALQQQPVSRGFRHAATLHLIISRLLKDHSSEKRGAEV